MTKGQIDILHPERVRRQNNDATRCEVLTVYSQQQIH